MSKKTKTLFAPNARPKTVMVEMTRARGGNNYTVDRVTQVDDVNQYVYTTKKLNKRDWTQEFKYADLTVL